MILENRGICLSNTVTEVSTLGDLLIRAYTRYPDRDALVLPSQRVTYADLYDGSTRVASALLSSGIEPGEHVAILIPNCVEYVEVLLGISLLG